MRTSRFVPLGILGCLFVLLQLHSWAQSTEQRTPLPDDKGVVAEAQKKLAADPKNVALIVALGNAQAGLQRITEAIATYTAGLEIDSDNVPLLLNRGHRYLNNRQFDLGLKDLHAAADLIHPEPLTSEMEDAFETYYHIGVGYYMKGDFAKAATAWDRCRELARTDDQRASSTDWSYMTYRRAKRDKEAAAILDKASPDWKITGSPYYFQRLLFYKGLKKEAELIDEKAAGVGLSTLLYGIGNWYLCNGDSARARPYFERAVKTSGWPAWGYIASEIELKRR